jgi:hypothetical protein
MDYWLLKNSVVQEPKLRHTRHAPHSHLDRTAVILTLGFLQLSTVNNIKSAVPQNSPWLLPSIYISIWTAQCDIFEVPTNRGTSPKPFPSSQPHGDSYCWRS